MVNKFQVNKYKVYSLWVISRNLRVFAIYHRTIKGIANYHTCLNAKSLLGISTCVKWCQMLHITYKAYKYNFSTDSRNELSLQLLYISLSYYNMQAEKFQACVTVT